MTNFKNIYDLVLYLLRSYDSCRNSDKALIWSVYEHLSLIVGISNSDTSFIMKKDFFSGPSFESITRARRKAQEQYPELQASASTQKLRSDKESSKGLFIFTEK